MALPRLERPVHYGNTGLAFNESKPPDDEYVFPPENTRDVWSHIREITDRYGYDFQSNEDGNFVLMSRNNPHVIQDLTTDDVGGSPTEEITPNSYTGTYLEWTGTGPSLFTIAVTAARVDLVVPTGDGYGAWEVTVKRGAQTLAGPIIIDPDTGAGTEDLFYYDFRTTTDGSNPTVAKLYSGFFGPLTLEIKASGGSATRRLDCIQLWHTDPDNPLYSTALATDENAVTVQAQSTMDDMRNYVIIVGRRRAIVTDSEKLETNPNNPSSEFIVRSAVDVRSIVNPFESDDTTVTPNYIGFTKESIIFDSGIADEDFATYLARTFIFRQRLPNPNAAIRHTMIPAMQLRDPVFAVEADFGTIDNQSVLYTVGFTHRYSATDGAFTQVVTSSFPEFPSYEVREDIDINATFNGKPVANVVVSYTSLSDDAQSNLGIGLAKISADTADVVQVTGRTITSSPDRLVMTSDDWPPLPGTIFLSPAGFLAVTSQTVVSPDRLVAAPGTAFYTEQLIRVASITRVTVEQRDKVILAGLPTTRTARTSTATEGTGGSGGLFNYSFDDITQVLTIYRTQVGSTFPNGDGIWSGYRVTMIYDQKATGVGPNNQTNTPYHHLMRPNYSDGTREILLPWEHGDSGSEYDRQNTTFDITYRRLGPVDGGGAFSNPYTAGNVPFYDPYSSELGLLINLTFDALVSGVYRLSIKSSYDDTTVAWLTSPTGDPDDEEAHWDYITAGGGKTYAWDGIDQIGVWNTRQSTDYATAAFGAFEVAQRPSVQAGFYAWNREELVTSGRQEIALISGDRDGSGRPTFGQGTFAEWYILIEADTDVFGRVSADTRKLNEVGAVGDLDDPANDYFGLIYTHLPDPTKVSVAISDWEDSGDTNAYDPLNITAINTTANWTTVDTDARINNQKPVRTRFTVANRPGPQWTGNSGEASIRLFRNIHLRANIFDQFLLFEGSQFPGTNTENRKITTRKLTVDDHTIVFQDDNYRKAKSFKTADGGQGTEWIFIPSDLKKDFRNTGDESIEFGNYLQLTEVPQWNTAQAIAGSRSRYSLGFINYLFYLSVYTQDRSGRFTWCINTGFLDRSKILRNQAADWDDTSNPTEWPDDLTLQFRRSVIARQWTDEGEASAGNSWRDDEAAVGKWGFDTTDVGYAFLRHKWKDHDPAATSIAGLTWASLTGGISGGGQSLKPDDWSNWHAVSAGSADGRLPGNFGGMNRSLGNASTTELGNWTWEISPRWIPCVTRDWHGYWFVPPMMDNRGAINVHQDYFYGLVDYRDLVTGGDQDNTGDDAASLPTWHSPIHDDTEGAANKRRFWVGRTTVDDREPTKTGKGLPITAASMDYQRQDDMIHYEQLRGNFSRGPRPVEAPKYVVPGSPYYQNMYRYTILEVVAAKGNTVSAQGGIVRRLLGANFQLEDAFTFGLFKTHISGWFEMTFRYEYIWENSRMFPVHGGGKEFPAGMNDRLARITTPRQLAGLHFDAGAWAGWKDDAPNTGLADGAYRLYHSADPESIFDSIYLPLSVGPQLAETTDMIFHMILVDSRREVPVL